jgi:GNAT superfamily N-acetyltransferase
MARVSADFARALCLPAGECVTLRPVTPDDAEALQAYVRALSPEARYNRFFGALQELPPAELERVTHLDCRYDLALLAAIGVGATSIVIGEARHAFAPERRECEFALSVADAWRGRGIGTLLIGEMERRARRLGARRLTAETLRDNEPMKALALTTGFRMSDLLSDARLVRIVKDMATSRTDRPGSAAGTPDLPLAA